MTSLATYEAVRGDAIVFAAASLTDAFSEIAGQFEARYAGAKVILNFGGSNQLIAQMEQGARADVFASADQAQMARAKTAGLIIGEVRNLATNRLTIIVHKENPLGIQSLMDLAKPGVKLVMAQEDVPVGRYTREALAKAGQDSAYGPDFKTRVEANVVSREDNVRQIVAKVALGEGDAGIVYTSDVTPQMAGKLRTIGIPSQFDVLASYPIAQVSTGRNANGGRRFVDLVLSPDGQGILVKWRFGTVAP